MPRKVSLGGCVLAVVALFAAIAPAAQGANTWAGVWNTDFGRLTMSASGSGSYEGSSPGTVSGPAVGDVNEGTWSQPGPPAKQGPYRFVLSGGGQSFTGTWEYDAGGCGSACGWNGTCIEGKCLENGLSGGGGGGGGSCPARAGGSRLLPAFRFRDGDDDPECPPDKRWTIGFGFVLSGLPPKPDRSDLPDGLLNVEFTGSPELHSRRKKTGYKGAGILEMETFTVVPQDPGQEGGPGQDPRRAVASRTLFVRLAGPASYDPGPAKDVVKFQGKVESSAEPACPEGTEVKFAFGVNSKDEAALAYKGDCLSSKPVKWGPDAFDVAHIGKPKLK